MQFYKTVTSMDDMMPSAPTVDDATETTKQLTKLGDLDGFHIRKWIANELDVTADVEDKDRASEINYCQQQRHRVSCELPQTMDLPFNTRHLFQLDGFEFTKRNVLRRTAAVCDPLGIITLHNQVQVVDTKGMAGWRHTIGMSCCRHLIRERTKWFKELEDLIWRNS